MTYQEAKQQVSENLHLTGVFSPLKKYPFYIKYLLIIPKGLDWSERTKILLACFENNYNNETALIENGLINEDLEVVVFGSTSLNLNYGTSMTNYTPLEEYLSDLSNPS